VGPITFVSRTLFAATLRDLGAYVHGALGKGIKDVVVAA